ncbi:MAG: class I SAM-dependent methyltransferase [Caulobacter sp.]|nr:class I SAM-dependent methyltransferase [Caulobacter sp.]
MSAPPVMDQPAFWNARAGQTWVAQNALLDRLLSPLLPPLLEALDPAARRVLDIGCGAGATTLAAAARLGPDAWCLGADVSTPLVEAARRRAQAAGAANVEFVVADAQRHVFEPAAFDAVISRFGVMFFDDPTAAFVNIRRAMRPGAGLSMVAWRSAADNPFMTQGERAAAPFLPPFPPRDPDGPGQFAFGDSRRVRGVLEGAGWREVEITPLDVPCVLPTDDLAVYAAVMGPVGQVLPDQDEATREAVLAAMDKAFAAYVSDGAARFTAACWLLKAEA